MKEILKNYIQPILLLLGITAGGLLGALLPLSVPYLRPVGDMFMNVLFVLIVPLVFFSVSSSVSGLTRRKALGKMLGTSTMVWLVLMLVYGVVTYLLAVAYSPLDPGAIMGNQLPEVNGVENSNVGQMLVGMLTVNDFGELFSVRHILPLLLMSILLGWGAAKLDDDGVSTFLQKGNLLIGKMMGAVMLLSPLGLGCYFAGVAADMGGMLLAGFGRVLLQYVLITLAFFLVLHPLMVLPCLGRKGMRAYWRAIFSPSITAISSLSSSATMPQNIAAMKELGLRSEVTDAVIPMGTQLFKVGSVMSSAHKVIFLLLLSGECLATPQSFLLVVGLGILGSLVVGAVPTGAGTAEVLICSILGVDPMLVGMLFIISAIEDMPGTLINVNGNSTAAIIVNKLTDKG